VISVVQADPEWCGGVSEMVKICALADYLINKMSYYYFFEKHDPKPVEGKIALSDRPGFGIEFDESKIEKQTLVSWS